MPMITSVLDNPKAERIRRAAELSNARSRRRSGRLLIEGPQAVREAVKWTPTALSDLYVQVAESHDDGSWTVPDGPLPQIVDAASSQPGLYVHGVTEAVMNKLSSNAQGIAAVGEIDALSPAYDDALLDVRPCIAAFWQVRDPGNAGAVIRAADAAGCDAVMFVDDCVDRFNPKVVRSTAGSLFHIPVFTMSTQKMFSWCARREITVVAADIYGTAAHRPEQLPTVLSEHRMPASRLLLFGNEARGLPQSLLEQVDRIVTIPIYGKAESLNLATSVAVMLFALAMSSHIARM